MVIDAKDGRDRSVIPLQQRHIARVELVFVIAVTWRVVAVFAESLEERFGEADFFCHLRDDDGAELLWVACENHLAFAATDK